MAEDAGLDRFRSLVTLASQAFKEDFRYGEAMATQANVFIQRQETSSKTQREQRESARLIAV